jgi:hypothetical protein
MRTLGEGEMPLERAFGVFGIGIITWALVLVTLFAVFS